VGDEIPHAICDLNSLAGSETPEKIEQKQCLPNLGVSSEIAEAASWLSKNGEHIRGNPLLLARFQLSILDAVVASKTAHALRYGEAKAV